jgi:hypothetical protein
MNSNEKVFNYRVIDIVECYNLGLVVSPSNVVLKN